MSLIESLPILYSNEINGDIEFDFFILYNEYMEGLHSPVNKYFPTDQYKIMYEKPFIQSSRETNRF